jgi:hypothetical protein
MSNHFLSEIAELSDSRKQAILTAKDNHFAKGTKYYVSADGCDANDGLSPKSAWKTLQKVSAMASSLQPGDAVLFRRGDVFRGNVAVASGVTYAAYGSGEKPRIYGGSKNLSDPALWTEIDAENHIWQLNEEILDIGTLVFNDGQYHAYKHIPSYINGQFVCRDEISKPFIVSNELKNDLDLFWQYDKQTTTIPSKGQDFPIPDLTADSFGTLYLRCNEGNPGEVFESIEPVVRRHGFLVLKNHDVHIDNICIRYFAQHGVCASGHAKNLHVSNCEIGWIGGSIQHYKGTDPNYPEGPRGSVTRYGNGIEVYGGCENYLVENCYIYQCYDAGITHQVTTNGKFFKHENVTYRNNLIDNCVYAIEYFLDKTGGDTESYMRGIEISGNILQRSGYGWGQQRHNKHTPAHIKGWSYINTASDYRIFNNIFDRSAFRLLHLVAEKEESLPQMQDNIYIQNMGGMIGQYGFNAVKEPDIVYVDENFENTVRTVFKDETAKTFICD